MFKVGDTVKVTGEFVVERIDDDGDVVLQDFRTNGGNGWVKPELCTLIEPPLKVGDWVRDRERFIWQIRFIDADDGSCLLRNAYSDDHTILNVSYLTRIKKP